MTTKLQTIKTDKLYFIKIKNIFFSMNTFKKVKEQLTREKTYVHTKVCTHICTSALFIIGKNRTKYSSVDE